MRIQANTFYTLKYILLDKNTLECYTNYRRREKHD